MSRYSRHFSLPEVGEEGQRRLRRSSLLLIGAGGLGSPAALYLVAAGVGRVGLVDPDRVDESNLQRQILHGTADCGALKVDSAARRLSDLNPEVELELHPEAFAEPNARRLVEAYDLVVDGSDNLQTRYLANDACFFASKAYLYASVYRFEGQLALFQPGQQGPCYRCLFPLPAAGELVPSCSQAGVLGPVPGLAGVLQANEALLYLLGQGSSRVGRLLTFDLLGRCFREVKMGRDPKCPLCGQQPQIKDLRAENLFCGDPMSDEITPAEFKTQWDGGRRPTLIDVRRQDEWDTANLAEYGAKLIPLHEFEQRYQEIPKDADIVLHCKSGGRSGQAQRFLQSQGYTRVQNMAGGIGGWSDEVDSSKTKY